jgi:hypothetical protein
MRIFNRANTMKQENERCHWVENEHGNWVTGCYHAFSVDHGSPHDNDMTFCPFCGGRLTEHKYTFTASSDAAETPPVAQSPATESPSGWLNNSEAAGGEFPVGQARLVRPFVADEAPLGTIVQVGRDTQDERLARSEFHRYLFQYFEHLTSGQTGWGVDFNAWLEMSRGWKHHGRRKYERIMSIGEMIHSSPNA